MTRNLMPERYISLFEVLRENGSFHWVEWRFFNWLYIERFSYDLEKWFRFKVFVICFIREKIKTWTLRFPAKENRNIMEKAWFDWPIVLPYDVKAKYRLISRKFSGMKFFQETTKNHAHLYPFDKPIKSLYFRSFVVSVLCARFHFKVIRKSLNSPAMETKRRVNDLFQRWVQSGIDSHSYGNAKMSTKVTMKFTVFIRLSTQTRISAHFK